MRTQQRGKPPALAKWLVTIAVGAVVGQAAVEHTSADTPGGGALLRLVLGTGLIATFLSSPLILARMPWQWWLVNSGAFVLMRSAMGAVLGAWQ